MPPKPAAKTTSSSKSKRSERGHGGALAPVEDDEGLQAIVIADIFDKPGLQPLQLDTAPALLPIANVPGIEYTLEFLSNQNGMTEIVVFSNQHVDQLRSYLAGSRWRDHVIADSAENIAKYALPRIKIVSSSTVSSAGDAFRLIDQMGLIRSETFLIVDTPIFVSNMDLSTAITSHQARNKEDSNAILTLVMRPGSIETSANPSHVFHVAVNNGNGRLLSYDETPFEAFKASKLTVPRKVLKEDASAVSELSLLDSRVYICAASVLIHFSDNYDYADMRRHYIHNEVLNFDMDFRFFLHVATEATGIAVTNFRSLFLATFAVLKQHIAPIRANTHWAASALHFVKPEGERTGVERALTAGWVKRGRNSYVQEGAVVSSSVSLINSVISAGATVGDNAVLTNTVVGPLASLGANVRLSGCVVGAEAVIGANSEGEGAFVGFSSKVGSNVSLSASVVIGSKCVIADSTILPSYVRITAVPSEGKPSARSDTVGAAGVGRVWPDEEEAYDLDVADEGSDDEEGIDAAESFSCFAPEHVRSIAAAVEEALQTAKASGRGAANEAAAIDSTRRLLPRFKAACAIPTLATAWNEKFAAAAAACLQIVLDGNDVEHDTGASESKQSESKVKSSSGADFAGGVRDMIMAKPDPAHIRELGLEIKSFKYAENKTFADVLRVLVPVILELVPARLPDVKLPAFQAALKNTINAWKSLIAIFVTDPSDEAAISFGVEDYVRRPENQAAYSPIFGVILHTLYDLDVASDVAISEWAMDREETDDLEGQALLHSNWVQKLLEILDESDDEEDGDEDDEEGSENEED